MHESMFLDIFLILALSAAALLVCSFLRIPSIVGFLIAGIVAGPHGFALVQAVREVEQLAEIGVVLLLFTLGIEFSFSTLLRLRSLVLFGGVGQVLLTITVTALVLSALGVDARSALVGGMLVALSSTAIVLKTLHQRAETDALHGRFSIGVLILQDLMIVPMMLAIPLLAGTGGLQLEAVLPVATRTVVAAALVFVGARWVLPKVLDQVAGARDPELFQIAVVTLGFGIALLTAWSGLELAMGAFLAGLIISESPYAHRALGGLLPLRELFLSFFFVSIGMLFDLRALAASPMAPLFGTVGLIVIKAVLAFTAGVIAGLPARSAVIAALALAQIGEFSFVLAGAARHGGLLDQNQFQLVIGVSTLSMAATPFLIQFAPSLADQLGRLRLPHWLRVGRIAATPLARLVDHLTIIGFGLVGRHLAEAAESAGIEYVAIDGNPDTVRRELAAGRPIFYGDATQETSLRHAHLDSARVVVVTIGDAAATRRVVERARQLNPGALIVARTRFVSELAALRGLGADEIVSDEYETSIVIFTRVLERYLVPQDSITAFSDGIRANSYEALRTSRRGTSGLADLDLILSDHTVRVARVGAGAGAVGHTLAQLDFRRSYGILVLAIRRDGKTIQIPDGDAHFAVDDEVVMVGTPDLLPFAESIFRAKKA